MSALSFDSALHLIKVGGRPAAARRSRWSKVASDVIERSDKLKQLADDELEVRGREVRWRAKAGEPLDQLLPDAYALVREAADRTLGMRHFRVQIMGAMALFEGNVAEMQTGEGKTLTATMPAYIRALSGLGTHVITVNDDLANRDADIVGEVYRKLGLTVGKVLEPMEPPERRENYACDITYGTAKEMGFDFLRDRLRKGASQDDEIAAKRFGQGIDGAEKPVQRGYHFALIDEADSILIDEAKTPLIIGLTQPNDPGTVNLYRWSHRATYRLEANADYVYEPDRRSAYLTDDGCRKIVLMSKPSLMNSMDTERIYTQVEKALTARHAFNLDRDYVVIDKKVQIVDESTGRIMDGRKWQDGLHQAIEAKELVPITAATGQAARITVQSFFRNYTHLGGMTGTATTASRELKKTYAIKVTKIPTNKVCIRKGLPHRVFATQEAKQKAIVEDIREKIQAGRSVLIGTPSVDASTALGVALNAAGIDHQVLNALNHDLEAKIVEKAGGMGRVTIATNMAGRGTDILLTDEVKQRGGLHVVATEFHTSTRIDRQLIGRSARQGDQGSYQFFLSLEDELLRCRDSRKIARRQKAASSNANGELGRSAVGYFKRTQKFLEKNDRKQRKNLLKQEKFRTEAYERMGIDPYLELTES